MPEALYRPVSPHVSWPEMEAGVLESWTEKRIYERSMALREGSPEWVFYEGPPTANGRPRGHYVHRKAGWDCHGLPVEIEVEKELGITQKRQIEEEVGIEEFVRRCRESVQRYVDDHRRLTDRIAFWQDLDDAYWTMTPDYIESARWIASRRFSARASISSSGFREQICSIAATGLRSRSLPLANSGTRSDPET